MSIGKIFPSLLSAAPELTLALANINLDFTVYKAPPPPEYRGLGNALSALRKSAAEDGHEHLVARKLTRLFQKHLPEVPTLLAAYGHRASEIAKKKTSSATASKSFGVFADHVGLDGTSIWAAATSGQEALCIHLLACMLARIWSGPQATSIWVEIVEERKQELLKLPPTDPLHLSDIAAANIDLTREDLAGWDASARSWLVIADDAMKKEQTQFLLLVDNTALPVDLSPGVYKSVIAAWTTALITIDKICGGMSYEVQNGAVLLGLASWHLFPDIYLLHGGQNKVIKQLDAVIANAGILTFGLEGRTEIGTDNEGLRWSLPLAHLRFYGDPVQISQRMSTGSLRLTLTDFHLVVLGCVLARWGDHADDIYDAANLIVTAWQFLSRAASQDKLHTTHSIDYSVIDFQRSDSWLRLLADAAENLIGSEGLQRQAYESLVERGYRRYETFLAPVHVTQEPMFDLGTLKNLIPILHEQSVIDVLRRYVKDAGLNADDIIIRYQHKIDLANDGLGETQAGERRQKRLEERLGDVSLPKHKRHSKTDYPTTTVKTEPVWQPVHSTIDFDEQRHAEIEMIFEEVRAEKNHNPFDFLETMASLRKRNLHNTYDDAAESLFEPKSKRHKGIDPPSIRIVTTQYEYATVVPVVNSEGIARHGRWIVDSKSNSVREERLEAIGEEVHYFSPEDILEFDELNFSWRIGPGRDVSDATWDLHQSQVSEDKHYSFLVGHPTIGAIFVRVGADVELQDALMMDEMIEVFKRDEIVPTKFLGHLSLLGKSEKKRDRLKPSLLVHSLRGVAAASGVYKLMPNATITTGIFSKPLYHALWLQDKDRSKNIEESQSTAEIQIDAGRSQLSISLDDQYSFTATTFSWLLKYPLDRSRTFACIAMFENASLNVDPAGLREVMALSAANSLYVAMPLLCDPFVLPLDHEVKHVIGNIGRPGITFLVPPPNPMVKKDTGWMLEVHHAPFDGVFEDKFQSTSLHLSFTRFVIPLGQTNDGGQDVEACFRQALVRLHGPDGKWVADLDVLGSMTNPLFQRLADPNSHPCNHTTARQKTPGVQLKAIDTWSAFLDRPKKPGIVRATGNWLARLAAATLNVQLGFPVLVMPDSRDFYADDADSSKEKKSTDKLCWACTLSHFSAGPRRGLRRSQVNDNSYKADSLPFIIT